MERRGFIALSSAAAASTVLARIPKFGSMREHARTSTPDYRFKKTLSRQVLENYLSRSISMEGLLNERGNLNDNIRMLKEIGAKYIGRSICLWGREAELMHRLDVAKEQVPLVHAAGSEMILEACIFEIVTTEVESVPVPD